MKYLAILPILAMFSSAAYADTASDYGFYFKPYVGADYDLVHADYKDSGDTVLNDIINGGDVHVGARVHKYLGFEASYLWTADASKDNVLGSGLNTKVSFEGGTLDAMGYLPIGFTNDKLELIGTAGVSRLKAKLDLSGLLVGSGSEWETKGRVGGGVQYWLTDNLNVRGLIRYQGANFSGNLDDAIIYSLGLNWQF